MFTNISKISFILVINLFLFIQTSKSSDYNEIIDRIFSDRKLDSIEGIWKKTLANEGPSGCITMFYKDNDNVYYQMHIDSCFVMGKITGKQKRLSDTTYKGENAVYFYNGDVNWGPSNILISKNYESFLITHNSYNNVFREKWERIWPEDIEKYNKSIEDNN